MSNKSYVGDIGTRIRSYLRADITDASGIAYYWKKPVSGAEDTTEIVTHPCGVEDYISGVVYYDTQDTNLDVAGQYKHQVLVIYNNGDRFRSHTKSFDEYTSLNNHAIYRWRN